MDLTEAYSKAAARAGELVAGVRPEQLDEPSPCRDWTARALVNHIVGGQFMFAGAASGAPLPDLSAGPPDFTEGDAVQAHRDGVAAATGAFSDPGIADKMAELPFGTVPAAVVPGLACFEAIVHGWDLAQATGQDAAMPEDAVATLLPFAEQFLADVPRDGHAFDPVVTVADDAPAIDRLLGLAGRRP